MTWWSLYLQTSWNNAIWSLKLGFHFLYKWTIVWFQNLTWRYSSRMHTARLETVRASVSVATTRCRFRGVPPPDLTCPRWGSTPLTWPVPGSYLTMWPITWCMICYLQPPDRQMPVKTLLSRNFVCERRRAHAHTTRFCRALKLVLFGFHLFTISVWFHISL